MSIRTRTQRFPHLAMEPLESRRLLTAVCSGGRDAWTVGLVDCTSDAADGYTFVAPNGSSSAYLLDVHGREVHSWSGGAYERRFAAYLGDDGSLVSSGVAGGSTISGAGATGGLWIQDWGGNLLWNWTYSTNDYRLHHDIEPLPNGNVLAYAWVRVSPADVIAAGRDPSGVPTEGIWSERIIEVEPTGPTTGDIVWQWNVLDHVVQDFDPAAANFGVVTDHPELIDINFSAGRGRDWLHVNGIDYNAALDQIAISIPNFGEIWVLDHSTTSAEAATHAGGSSGMGGDLLYRWGNPQAYDRGTPADQQLMRMHDVQWIDAESPGAGNLLLFHNRSTGSTAELVELAPPVDAGGNYTIDAGMAYQPSEPTWSHETGVMSPVMSGTQRMPNGNTLAAYAGGGVISELTPNGDEVWRYINPARGDNIATQGASAIGGVLFKARRYEANFIGLAGRDLSASGYVENWLPGDYNLSASLNSSDIDALCGGLHTGDLIYDLDFDDVLDASDVAEMIEQMGLLLGDANFDGFVDGLDFIVWNDNKFTANGLYSQGDFDCDGFVDGLDFIIWNDNKFMSSGVLLVPPAGTSASVDPQRGDVLAMLPPDRSRAANAAPIPMSIRTSASDDVSRRGRAQSSKMERLIIPMIETEID